LNLLTDCLTETVADEVARRTVVHALREIGALVSENLKTLREKPAAWPDA
jgi:hypothetical protein